LLFASLGAAAGQRGKLGEPGATGPVSRHTPRRSSKVRSNRTTRYAKAGSFAVRPPPAAPAPAAGEEIHESIRRQREFADEGRRGRVPQRRPSLRGILETVNLSDGFKKFCRIFYLFFIFFSFFDVIIRSFF